MIEQLRATGLPRPSPRQLIAALRPAPGERILELRPGAGHHAHRVARHLGPTGRLDLVDIPEHMLDEAIHYLEARPTPDRAWVVPTVADPRTLPFADHTFTSAYVIAALSTFPDPGRVLDELHRVLQPTGRLVIADHRRTHWLPPDTARRLARRHGFSLITSQGTGRYVHLLSPLRAFSERTPALEGADTTRSSVLSFTETGAELEYVRPLLDGRTPG
ncbi:class I SAM-dependent methyltransferase [Pseudonocardia broussonetiae]|uniref:Class I SAM-dependent methyltransferase n=1 Tax=Pseudonocardia broussonetiae TaxID=2736640 RepID=A0A6M6JX92_9PSEU|nr:class I SAM-dependent methyltransferase [Pseudonocardia broussonetiae]QJY51142.1 class I SAM-dependent methyltransferase [Pseudonocardia broussonetiae]